MGSKGRPYRTVEVDGFEVLVGRSATDNDYLSLKIAKGKDLWLHVGSGVPGSHVVIRHQAGEEFPPEVVKKAAQLAAWYSKARGAPFVEVHVCSASQVSKASGAPVGQVQIRKYKRLKVRPSNLETDDKSDT